MIKSHHSKKITVLKTIEKLINNIIWFTSVIKINCQSVHNLNNQMLIIKITAIVGTLLIFSIIFIKSETRTKVKHIKTCL